MKLRFIGNSRNEPGTRNFVAAVATRSLWVAEDKATRSAEGGVVAKRDVMTEGPKGEPQVAVPSSSVGR